MNVYEILLRNSKGKTVVTFYFDRINHPDACKAYAEKVSSFISTSHAWTTIAIKEKCGGNILCQRDREGNWHDTLLLQDFIQNRNNQIGENK